MSFDTLRLGIVNNWPLGETPYDEEFNANLDIITDAQAPFMIDFRRDPQSDPTFQLPGVETPFTKINNGNGHIEFWRWEWDEDLLSDQLVMWKEVVPWVGMVVGVRADAAYAIFTSSGWRHLMDFRSPGAMEISVDCDFPRAGKTVASLFIPQACRIGPGQQGSQVRPSKNKTPDLTTAFGLFKNGGQFGTISIYGTQHSIMSPTIAISATEFEVGDRLTIKAPESVHGITGLNFTLRFFGMQ